jgi:hypothetical protein
MNERMVAMGLLGLLAACSSASSGSGNCADVAGTWTFASHCQSGYVGKTSTVTQQQCSFTASDPVAGSPIHGSVSGNTSVTFTVDTMTCSGSLDTDSMTVTCGGTCTVRMVKSGGGSSGSGGGSGGTGGSTGQSATKHNGQTCVWNNECYSAWCTGVSGQTLHCEGPKTAGQTCSKADDCRTGMTCSGVCVAGSGGSGGGSGSGGSTGMSACDSCLASCRGLSSCCTGSGCICQDECLPPVPTCTGGKSLVCDSTGFCMCMP